jgi:hypothetical protein
MFFAIKGTLKTDELSSLIKILTRNYENKSHANTLTKVIKGNIYILSILPTFLLKIF